tara:strand:+ start:1887 stop:2240 length:354 start_codon:yes stop_codon:yes gene_type:complete
MEIIMGNWKNKINQIKYGIIAGLTLPILGFFIGFIAKGGDMSFSTFWQIFTQNHDLLHMSDLKLIYQDTRQSTVMFCLLANMLAFYFSFFLNRLDRFSKGLVFITLLLAAVSVLFIY